MTTPPARDEREVNGLSLWEVVVRMDTKLDVALSSIADHETRLRNTPSNGDLEAVKATVNTLNGKVDLLTIAQTEIANRPYVTPKGLLAAVSASAASMVAVLTIIEKFIR